MSFLTSENLAIFWSLVPYRIFLHPKLSDWFRILWVIHPVWVTESKTLLGNIFCVSYLLFSTILSELSSCNYVQSNLKPISHHG